MNVTEANVAVPGARVGLLNGISYGPNGQLYAALQSNPPNYPTDRAFTAVRIDLASGAVNVLPLPHSNGNAAGVTFPRRQGALGLSTTTGVGVYSYDPTTNQASSQPVLSTVGDPTVVLAFP